MIKKVKRKVNLKDYDRDYVSIIEINNDLPWPEFVIHDNKVFRHEKRSVGDVGYYRRDLSFYNTTF